MERLGSGTDRCDSEGAVYELHTLVGLHGKISDPELEGVTLTTVNRVYVYAVNLRLEMRIAADGDRSKQGAVKHETLFQNADVIGAGEIVVNDGIVMDVNDRSGSYGTSGQLDIDSRFAGGLLTAMDRAQVSVDPSLRRRLLRLARA